MTQRRLWWIIAGLHLVAAVFSKGYHHPDEYFQIIEFARHKLLGTSGSELAWEYGARIRPWLQPAFYALLIKGMGAVGLGNPFSQTLVLRLVSAALGFASIVVLARSAARWLDSESAKTWLTAALGLAWCVPYLHARTSSENLATSFICFAVAALVDALDGRSVKLGVLTGVYAGLAFEARFQVGLMIVGVVAWLVAFRHWRVLLSATAGMTVIFALGRLVDRWGYGDWTLTPLAYFRVNIVESKASSFGVQPWWWYFRKVVSETPPPVGLLALAAVPWAWLRERRHVLTWATVPFLVGHVIIAHKELRFLFPMVPLVTTLLVVSFQRFAVPLASLPRWGRALALLLVLPNLAYLIMNCVKPVRGEVLVLESIWDNSHTPRDLYVADASPFAYRELEFGFYESPRVRVHYIDDYTAVDRALAEGRAPLLVYLSNNWLPPEAERLAERCSVVHRSFPEWVKRFNFKNWLQRTYQALLLECR